MKELQIIKQICDERFGFDISTKKRKIPEVLSRATFFYATDDLLKIVKKTATIVSISKTVKRDHTTFLYSRKMRSVYAKDFKTQFKELSKSDSEMERFIRDIVSDALKVLNVSEIDLYMNTLKNIEELKKESESMLENILESMETKETRLKPYLKMNSL